MHAADLIAYDASTPSESTLSKNFPNINPVSSFPNVPYPIVWKTFDTSFVVWGLVVWFGEFYTNYILYMNSTLLTSILYVC